MAYSVLQHGYKKAMGVAKAVATLQAAYFFKKYSEESFHEFLPLFP